jgi:hypothetical protein
MTLGITMFIATFAIASEGPAAKSPAFELQDGDRVAFVGNTFVERDQVFGYLETALTARWPRRNITFRNLGWSGDTVWGEARARFGTAEDGFKHLQEHIGALKPTVIFAAYGGNESFEGAGGIPRFEKGLNSLLDMFASAAPNVRVVLLSPLRHENLGKPLPDPQRRNEEVKRYAAVIQTVAGERDCGFVNLYDALSYSDAELVPVRHTNNGLHLTAYGYWDVARVILRELGIEYDRCEVKFMDALRPSGSPGTNITDIDSHQQQRVRFVVQHSMLPFPLSPSNATTWDASLQRKRPDLGLAAGRYRVLADGVELGVFDQGNPPDMESGPDYLQVEQLRQAIIEKNRLYFHRWRPQNETYLFGFRKHEQGQNAAEVPQFDPLVQEMESKIAKLRVPVKHTYEVVRE